MKDVLINVLFLALWIGLPVAGLVAAVLVAGWPLRPASRWWSLTYAALVTALSTWITVTNWSPDNESNGLRLAAVALAAGALATTLLLGRMSPRGHAFGLVRGFASVACALSSVATVLLFLLGSSHG